MSDDRLESQLEVARLQLDRLRASMVELTARLHRAMGDRDHWREEAAEGVRLHEALHAALGADGEPGDYAWEDLVTEVELLRDRPRALQATLKLGGDDAWEDLLRAVEQLGQEEQRANEGVVERARQMHAAAMAGPGDDARTLETLSWMLGCEASAGAVVRAVTGLIEAACTAQGQAEALRGVEVGDGR